MRLLRSAEYRRMPWKNGGGETREIAVSPIGAAFETLDWRISLASVAKHGPFSTFDGMDRTLCVIGGAGVELQVGDRSPITLYVTSEPYSFDGEVATSARLIDGPIEDLSVMSRRGRFQHTVQRHVLSCALDIETKAHALMIYCQRGPLLCAWNGMAESLHTDDAALFDQQTQFIRLIPDEAAEIHVIRLVRCVAGL